MNDAIEVKNLTREYNGFIALNRFSLRVDWNEKVGLLGPNGAGKTTVLKILCGLIRPSSGEAYIDGIDVVRNREQALANIGAIVEAPEFYPFLTPAEILRYLGRLRGMDEKELGGEIDRVLRLVGLHRWKNVRVEKFSRGMKQRLALAQAILHDPKILILDEPSLGFDPRGMKEIRDLLKRVGKNKTIMLASHLLTEVEQVCEKVAVIDHGRLKAYEEIYRLKRKYGSLERAYLKLTGGLI